MLVYSKSTENFVYILRFRYIFELISPSIPQKKKKPKYIRIHSGADDGVALPNARHNGNNNK